MHLGSAGNLEPIPTVPRDNLSCWEFESSMWIFDRVGWVRVPDPVLFKGHSVGLCLFSSPTAMPAIPAPPAPENTDPRLALWKPWAAVMALSLPPPWMSPAQDSALWGTSPDPPTFPLWRRLPKAQGATPQHPPPRAGPGHSV